MLLVTDSHEREAFQRRMCGRLNIRRTKQGIAGSNEFSRKLGKLPEETYVCLALARGGQQTAGHETG